MHIIVFGLGMSSSWGNGHATLWRGLARALSRRGHTLTFYEKDVPYYASTRDGWFPPPGIKLRLYSDLRQIHKEVTRELQHADLAVVTSYCPDGVEAAAALLDSPASVKAFYDLDTPVTLNALECGNKVPYLPVEGLGAFDLVLSFTGGRALLELQTRLGAQAVKPFYGWVDPDLHCAAPPRREFRAELNYLGTFAADRQLSLQTLFLDVANARPGQQFALGGALYPEDFPRSTNILFVQHVPPALHSAFFCSGRATLNITRGAMAQYGFCPSGRLFEAAACGVPILSDTWEGIDCFFAPGSEIVLVRSTADVLNALSLTDRELRQIGTQARERVLTCHTAEQRVLELEAICETVGSSIPQPIFAHSEG